MLVRFIEALALGGAQIVLNKRDQDRRKMILSPIGNVPQTTMQQRIDAGLLLQSVWRTGN